jgi:hypothetical protein
LAPNAALTVDQVDMEEELPCERVAAHDQEELYHHGTTRVADARGAIEVSEMNDRVDRGEERAVQPSDMD